MNVLRFLAAALASAALALAPLGAGATVATTTVSVAADQWYDLGAGPATIEAQAPNIVARWRVDDSQPSASATGILLPVGTAAPVNATSHIWAKTDSGSTSVVVAPLSASGGGGGGGAVTSIDGGLVTLGALADAACGTDNGGCTVEAVLKRVAQRITSLIAATLAVTDSTTETNTGTTNTNLGAPGATACSTDTGSCNVNAQLQRIAQRITSLIAATLTINLPSNAAQETGGNLATLATNLPAKGQSTKSGSTPVTLASDQGAVSVGGYDSGPVSLLSSALNAGSYSAGYSLGGLLSIPLARINGGSGIVTSFFYKSTKGSAGLVVVRIWEKSPASTTCTDHSAFAGSETDDAYLITPPFSVTPAAPGVATGDAYTYASVLGATWDYKNSDTSPSQNLYVCVLAAATDTTDESGTIRVGLSGPQN